MCLIPQNTSYKYFVCLEAKTLFDVSTPQNNWITNNCIIKFDLPLLVY